MFYKLIKYFRYSVQKNILQVKSQKIWEITKREFTKVTQQSCAKENAKEFKLSPYILKFGFGGFGVTGAYILKSHDQIVICREAKRISDIKPQDSEFTFEWRKFFKYLYPHIWYLLLALSVSICNLEVLIVLLQIILLYAYRAH